MTDMSVAGDEDQWMLLERSSSAALPVIVRSRVNPAIAEFAAENLVTAVICDIHSQFVRDDGMPTCMEALYEHEDRLIGLIAETGQGAYHTASATGDGRRTIYIAHAGDADFRRLLSSVGSDVATVSVFTDFDFGTYREFVTPSALDKQLDGDRRVIDNLQSHGDDGSQPRKIDFWFYGDRSSLDRVVERLAGTGFVLDHWLDEPVGAVLSLEASANLHSFHDLTPLLVEAAQEMGVEYDGWETLVLSERPADSVPPSKPSLFGRLFGQRKN